MNRHDRAHHSVVYFGVREVSLSRSKTRFWEDRTLSYVYIAQSSKVKFASFIYKLKNRKLRNKTPVQFLSYKYKVVQRRDTLRLAFVQRMRYDFIRCRVTFFNFNFLYLLHASVFFDIYMPVIDYRFIYPCILILVFWNIVLFTSLLILQILNYGSSNYGSIESVLPRAS